MSRPDATDPLDRIETLWAQEYGPEELDAEIVRDVLALVAVARAAREICDEPTHAGSASDKAVRMTSYRALRETFAPLLARLDKSAEGGAR